ncbi:hypothetical protein IRY61_03545 [Candidatus Saccharibacteria bacterium]|nr:hypothetical protein [Candidatus Saccharibacteria bacterium]
MAGGAGCVAAAAGILADGEAERALRVEAGGVVYDGAAEIAVVVDLYLVADRCAGVRVTQVKGKRGRGVCAIAAVCVVFRTQVGWCVGCIEVPAVS